MFCVFNPEQEAIEELGESEILDLEQHGKLHLLSGGTKVVQHSAPPKSLPGLKGIQAGVPLALHAYLKEKIVVRLLIPESH